MVVVLAREAQRFADALGIRTVAVASTPDAVS
jgi:hypothetical protein